MSVSVQEITLTVPDISCGHCVATVEQAVRTLAGVASVKASDETKLVDVAFDPTLVEQPQIEAAIKKAGYPVAH